MPRPQPGRIGADRRLGRRRRARPLPRRPPARRALGRRLARAASSRCRCFGSWSRMPGLPTQELPVEDEEPVAVLDAWPTCASSAAMPFLRPRAGGTRRRSATRRCSPRPASPASPAAPGLDLLDLAQRRGDARVRLRQGRSHQAGGQGRPCQALPPRIRLRPLPPLRLRGASWDGRPRPGLPDRAHSTYRCPASPRAPRAPARRSPRRRGLRAGRRRGSPGRRSPPPAAACSGCRARRAGPGSFPPRPAAGA